MTDVLNRTHTFITGGWLHVGAHHPARDCKSNAMSVIRFSASGVGKTKLNYHPFSIFLLLNSLILRSPSVRRHHLPQFPTSSSPVIQREATRGSFYASPPTRPSSTVIINCRNWACSRLLQWSHEWPTGTSNGWRSFSHETRPLRRHHSRLLGFAVGEEKEFCKI